MKPDDFEQRLAQTRFRQPPRAWRDEILDVARDAASQTPDRVAPASRPIGAPAWRVLWREWFERVPAPWTIVAAAASVVLLLHGVGSGLERPLRPLPASQIGAVTWPAVLAAGRQYQAEVAALAAPEAPDAEASDKDRSHPPADVGRPRSEWRPGRIMPATEGVRGFA
jgi:hypothetical protein